MELTLILRSVLAIHPDPSIPGDGANVVPSKAFLQCIRFCYLGRLVRCLLAQRLGSRGILRFRGQRKGNE
jgi:hypothetical protein